MENFLCPTRIVSGAGALGYLRTLGPRRLFLVTDPYFEKNGTARRIAESSGAEQWEIFGDITPDPSAELAARGAKRLKAFGPDLLAAVVGLCFVLG